jgi:hypothetical protein
VKKGLLDRWRRSESADVVVVSGLPRSGTSLMMKMLAAGGIPSMTDGIRRADTDNPGGYYELENAKRLSSGDVEWLTGAPGHAVKVIATLLPYLPATYTYRVVFMRRRMSEVLASQRTMLVNRDEDPDAIPDDEMTRLYTSHLDRLVPWLRDQPNFSTLYIDYNDLVERRSVEQIDPINRFLGGALDVASMRAVVDPDLYRQRGQS